jgi:hypothetical protein
VTDENDLPSAEEARSVVQRIMAALPAGSHLVVVDGANTNPELNDVMRIWNESANPPYAMRSPEEIAGYFDGLELVEPGLVDVTRWRPDPARPARRARWTTSSASAASRPSPAHPPRAARPRRPLSPCNFS